MKTKQVKVSFSVSGTIEQTLEVPADMTLSELEDQLNNGQIVTTVQEGGSLDVTATGNSIGKVLDVDNQLEYEDFDCSYFE